MCFLCQFSVLTCAGMCAQVFPRMKNYTPYNRATSVGNQLLNNYRKFLLAYEVCHRSKDLAGPLPTPSATNEARPLAVQHVV